MFQNTMPPVSGASPMSGYLPPAKPAGKNNFFENLYDNTKEMATGFFPAIAGIGKGLAHDAARVATLGSYGDEFRTDDNAKMMYEGFRDSSFIPMLLPLPGDNYSFNPMEAGKRAYERPLDAFLDSFGLAAGGAGAAARGTALTARTGKLVGLGPKMQVNPKYMRMAGYDRVRSLTPDSMVPHLDAQTGAQAWSRAAAEGTGRAWTGPTSRAAGINAKTVDLLDDAGKRMGESSLHRGNKFHAMGILDKNELVAGREIPTYWAKQTHRNIGTGKLTGEKKTLLPGGKEVNVADDMQAKMERLNASRRRSLNPMSAKIGDTIEDLYSKHIPHNMKFLGNGARISRYHGKRLSRSIHMMMDAANAKYRAANAQLKRGVKPDDFRAYEVAAEAYAQGYDNIDDFINASHETVYSGEFLLNRFDELEDMNNQMLELGTQLEQTKELQRALGEMDGVDPKYIDEVESASFLEKPVRNTDDLDINYFDGPKDMADSPMVQAANQRLIGIAARREMLKNDVYEFAQWVGRHDKDAAVKLAEIMDSALYSHPAGNLWGSAKKKAGIGKPDIKPSSAFEAARRSAPDVSPVDLKSKYRARVSDLEARIAKKKSDGTGHSNLEMQANDSIPQLEAQLRNARNDLDSVDSSVAVKKAIDSGKGEDFAKVEKSKQAAKLNDVTSIEDLDMADIPDIPDPEMVHRAPEEVKEVVREVAEKNPNQNLAFMKQHRSVINDAMADVDRMNDWYEYRKATNQEAGEYVFQNYQGVLKPEDIKNNNYRMARMMYGDKPIEELIADPTNPLKREPIYKTFGISPDADDYSRGSKGGESLLAKPTLPPKAHTAGRFLFGTDRWDSKAGLDNLIDNAKMHYGNVLLDDLDSVALKIPVEELSDKMSKKIIAHADDKVNAPFTILSGSRIEREMIRNTRAVSELLNTLEKMDGIDPRVIQDIERMLADDAFYTFAAHQAADAIGSKAELNKFAKDMARRVKESGGDVSKVTDDMHVTVLPSDYYAALVKATATDGDFIRNFIDRPLNVWKQMVLHYRAPGWIKNNAIGSFIFLAMASNSYQAVKHLTKNSKAFKALKKKLYPEMDDGWSSTKLQDDFRDVLQETANTSMATSGFEVGAPKNAFTRTHRKFTDFVTDINAKWGDNPYRQARLTQVLDEYYDEYSRWADDMGAVEKLDKDSFYQELTQHDGIRDVLAEEVLGDMIDFQDMTPFERRAIRRAIPFYSWVKGSTKRYGRAVADTPTKMWMQAQAAKMGTEMNEEVLGDTPEFMRGSVVLPGFLQNELGTRAISMNASNPFATPADVLGMGLHAMPYGVRGKGFGGDNVFAQSNPFIKGFVEATTRRDMFTGQPISNAELNMGELYASRVTNVPLMRWIPGGNPVESALAGPKHRSRPQYWRPPGMRTITSPKQTSTSNPYFNFSSYFMGVPVKDYRPLPYKRRAQEERAERY